MIYFDTCYLVKCYLVENGVTTNEVHPRAPARAGSRIDLTSRLQLCEAFTRGDHDETVISRFKAKRNSLG